ncbi:MAG: branched-chain amino acid ABC transporter permease, partial [Candidatus Ventricola sp.]
MFDLTRVLQTLTDALSLGSLYALIAIGYTMVYGVLRLINFAHGEIFMIAMYIVFYGISLFTLPWYVTFTVTILVTALLGTLAERLAYRPLRSAPRISILVSAIGVSYFLQNLATVIFGGRPLNFPQIPLFTDVLTFGDVYIQRLSLIVPIVTAVLLLMLVFLIKRTRTGMAMRAVARDYDASSLMGIDLNRTIAITFFIGSALAGVGAIMWGM